MDTLAKARARQDYIDGLAYDENPFPKNSPEAAHWDDEMDRLLTEESIRELSAA